MRKICSLAPILRIVQNRKRLRFEAFRCKQLTKLVLPIFVALEEAWSAMAWQDPQKCLVLDLGHALHLLLNGVPIHTPAIQSIA